jgi:hypothetical protein
LLGAAVNRTLYDSSLLTTPGELDLTCLRLSGDVEKRAAQQSELDFIGRLRISQRLT